MRNALGRICRPALACAAVLFSITASVWAQTSSSAGAVAGTVTDASAAAVAGAEIKLTDVATNTTQRTTTNDAGRYTFATVPPGTYDLIVTKTGFSTFKAASQRVDVGQVLTINASLEVGSTTTTVEVAAEAGAELQVTNATVGQTI